MPKEGLEPPFLSEPRSKRGVYAISPFGQMEVTGIEPVSAECKSAVLPLNYTPKNFEPFTRDDSGLILTLPRVFPRKRMSAPFIKLTQNGTR